MYKVLTLYTGTKVDTGSLCAHNIKNFVSSGQSTALFLLLSSCVKMASNRAKLSHYVHSHISGTQKVNTTLYCAGNQALVPGHRVDNPFKFLLSSKPRPCFNLGTGMICVDQKWGEIG